ncbi:hypothetical protein BC941DRAFT_432825 [Chlamydoabsidia padenii]|nr:hypothetical protein BC941DRAFT_432825 [Chlamydoabsidia padenii]
MDTPPPYSEIEKSGSSRQDNRSVAESSRSAANRPLPSAPPVLYNTTSDAKITSNSSSFGVRNMSYLSSPVSFSPPNLPPTPTPQAPPLSPLMTVQPQWNSASSPSRRFVSSPGWQPSSPQQYGRQKKPDQSDYFTTSSQQQSSPHSPVSSISSSSQHIACPAEKPPLPLRRHSSSSQSSQSSTNSNLSCKSSPKPTEDTKAPKFNNRKTSIEMKGVNKRLDWLQPDWFGKIFSLKTTNAMVDVQGGLDAKSVTMVTTNAKVKWKGRSILCKEMDLRTTNAAVDLVGDSVDVTGTLKLKTTNAPLSYDKTILLAKDISAVTTNSEIRMRHAHIKRSLCCKTTNAPVNLYIQSVSTKSKSKLPPKIMVEVTTTNAPVIIHMPSDYAGEFKLTTTKAIVIEDQQNKVVYNSEKKELLKEGYRSKKSYGSLKVTTTEGDITVIFDQ